MSIIREEIIGDCRLILGDCRDVCQTCGELTIERDSKGVLRCFECRAHIEIRSSE